MQIYCDCGEQAVILNVEQLEVFCPKCGTYRMTRDESKGESE